MKPEDWRKGMENEAASVEDREWARETRQVARRQQVWRSTGHLFLALAVAEALLLLLNAVTVQQSWSAVQSRPWFTHEAAWWAFSLTLMLTLNVGAGVLLGLCRVAPRIALPVFLTFPVLQFLTGLMVSRPGRPFPGSTLESLDLYPRLNWEDALRIYTHPWGWAQFSVVLVGAWLGIRLGERLRSRRHRSRPA